MQEIMTGQTGALLEGAADAVQVHKGKLNIYAAGTVDGDVLFSPTQAGTYVVAQELSAGLFAIDVPSGFIKVTAGASASGMAVAIQNA